MKTICKQIAYITGLVLMPIATLASGSEDGNVLAPPVWSILPFIGILLSIALIPLINGTWWQHNFPKVSLAFGLPIAIWVFSFNSDWLIHTTIEYASFITLLGSLFVVSGGILIRGNFRGTPVINTCYLLIGSISASFIGTTGASMLLIRPLLRTNKDRRYNVHTVVFFIFLVSNIGGSLTPLGDPPLFLGFLKGVDFFWTLKLAPIWLFAVTIILSVYFIIDLMLFKKEGGLIKTSDQFKTTCSISGNINFLLLAGILGSVILYSKLPDHLGVLKDFIQISCMAIMAALSLKYTPKALRAENGFTWHPIKEVAILFASIFACMIPALKLLEMRGGELEVTLDWQYFWASGGLSSFLDNAPTYLTFLSLAKTIPLREGIKMITLTEGMVPESTLLAISAGAVFMGANTYIGNGPNFMVKAVAEDGGIKMPTFIGYMGYSISILIPTFILITFVFFK